MSDMNESILSKVKKLFALGSSSNEAEASSAIEKAHKLLKDYNLSIDDISVEHKYGIIEDTILEGTNDSKWKSILLSGVAKANYCEALTILTSKNGKKYTLKKFVGKQHNIIVAKEMVNYLIDTVERLSKKMDGSDRGSYKNGISYKLYHRLIALREVDRVECTALVVQEETMIKDYFSTRGVQQKQIALQSRSSSAYSKGSMDGDKVSLHGQIC